MNLTDIRARLPHPVLWFVLRREDSEWTIATKVMDVCASEEQAHEACLRLQRQYPNLTYGVAVLTHYSRQLPDPVELVKVY